MPLRAEKAGCFMTPKSQGTTLSSAPARISRAGMAGLIFGTGRRPSRKRVERAQGSSDIERAPSAALICGDLYWPTGDVANADLYIYAAGRNA